MKSKIVVLLLSLSFLSCTTSNKSTSSVAQKAFTDKKGCFLLYNIKTGEYEKEIGGEDCSERYPACSTFKVPLAVMAFDSGILQNQNTIFKWDGNKEEREVANKNHTAKTWMSDSIVWYSQRITPKLGKNKLQKYLNEFSYGNKDFSQGIKTAWLVAPNSSEEGLEISAYEQVEFMKKLWSDSLPASKSSMQLTRDITFLEKSPGGFLLSGKTGSNFYDQDRKERLGWFIAHISNGEKEYIAVTNFSDLKPTEEKGYGGFKAKEITINMLKESGLW